GAYAGTADRLKSMWLDPGAYDLTVSAKDRESFHQRVYVLSGKSLKITAKLDQPASWSGWGAVAPRRALPTKIVRQWKSNWTKRDYRKGRPRLRWPATCTSPGFRGRRALLCKSNA